MNLAFNYENPVNHFKVLGDVSVLDTQVIRSALFRFFASNPSYVILNFSESSPSDEATQAKLDEVLIELTSLALSKKIVFQIVKTIEEAYRASFSILEDALNQKIELLDSKNQVKEDLQNTSKLLLEENQSLKDMLASLAKPHADSSGSLTTLLDKFWSDR